MKASTIAKNANMSGVAKRNQRLLKRRGGFFSLSIDNLFP
jgi:hypothetical protein